MFVINICERPRLFKESYTPPDGSRHNIYILFEKGKRKGWPSRTIRNTRVAGRIAVSTGHRLGPPIPLKDVNPQTRTCQNIQQTNENLKAHMFFFEIWTCSTHTHTHWIQTKTPTHKHRWVASVLVSTVRQRAITRLVSGGLNFWL